MDASASLIYEWSVIVSLSSLVAGVLLMATVTYLSFKRLLASLSSLNQTLQLCASELHRIAGDSSTEGYSAREVNR